MQGGVQGLKDSGYNVDKILNSLEQTKEEDKADELAKTVRKSNDR